MGELNYLRIAQILKGTITETEQPSFGCFGAARLSAERFRLLLDSDDREKKLNSQELQLIVNAFERVREGFEADRVLVDPVLYKKFIAEVRKLGVKAPEVVINKRLQAIRKASGYGIKLKKTTQTAGLDAEPFFYAAELGYVQMSYRRSVSIDDIITDPKIGDEYVTLCKAIAPDGTAALFKWAALRLRKMRYFTKNQVEKLLAVKAEKIEEKLKHVGTLDQLVFDQVPEGNGIFSFLERNDTHKYLYVGTSDNVRRAVEPFREAMPFKVLAGNFWKPSLNNISLHVASTGKHWLGASTRELGFRLIKERHPLFNMPVHLDAA